MSMNEVFEHFESTRGQRCRSVIVGICAISVFEHSNNFAGLHVQYSALPPVQDGTRETVAICGRVRALPESPNELRLCERRVEFTVSKSTGRKHRENGNSCQVWWNWSPISCKTLLWLTKATPDSIGANARVTITQRTTRCENGTSVVSGKPRLAVIAPCAISSDQGWETHIVPPS